MALVLPGIIDTHQHLWNLNRFRLPWVQPGSPLYGNFTLQDYCLAASGLGIERTIYMEVDVVVEQQWDEVQFVVETVSAPDSLMVAGVVSARPAADDFPAVLDRLVKCPAIKGVRQVLHTVATPAGSCLDPKFVRGIRRLGERGLTFDICIRCAELADAGRLVEACPGTQFILDHCGNPSLQAEDLSQWRRDISDLARHDNLACKISGLVNSAPPGAWGPETLAPILNHVIDTFGPDRIMFGGDWPVCTRTASLREWIFALQDVIKDRSNEVKSKLFADNAIRIYRLDPLP